MKKQLLFFLLLFAFFSTNAQIEVTGKVLDSTDLGPIIGATVVEGNSNGTTTGWQIIKALSLQARAATDESQQEYFNVEIDGTQHNMPGAIFIDEYDISERNYDLTLNGHHQFSNNFRVDISAGAVRTDLNFMQSGISGSDFINPGFIAISNMANRNPGTLSFERSRINAIFATTTLGINNYLYLEASLRNDFFSVLTNPRDVTGSENSIRYESGSVFMQGLPWFSLVSGELEGLADRLIY